MPKRKAFIDKKKSVAFRLVHRSQRDPLVAADDRGLVLAPVEGVEKLRIADNSAQNRENPDSDSIKKDPVEKRRDEQIKYGIYFDDDYDYLKHLKDANEVYSLEGLEERFRIEPGGKAIDAGKDLLPAKNTLELPASLFESKGYELKTGLLNQAAPLPGPHPELDPDIVAALDDDNYNFDDPENQLEDDFICKANAPSPSSSSNFDQNGRENQRFMQIREVSDEENDDSDEEDDCDSVVGSLEGGRGRFFDEEETKSRFTNYSLTSSVMRRSEGLKTVDAVFEKLYEQYDDDEIGELVNEDDEITGFIKPESERMLQLIKEHEKETKKDKILAEELFKEKDATLKNLPSDDENEQEKYVKAVFEDNRKDKWDCESILSTYSTLYNHPTIISEPRRKRQKILKLNPKTGLPEGVLNDSSLAPTLAKLNDGHVTETDNHVIDQDHVMDHDQMTCRTRASTIRSKNETAEERRNRKNLIKIERKERRIEKKMNKVAFKTEELRRNKVQLNLRQNLNGTRLL